MMDMLALLNGQTVAFNPLSIVILGLIGWVIRAVARNREEAKDAIAGVKTDVAVILNNQGTIKDHISELVSNQAEMLKTMNRQHGQNIRAMYRNRVGVPGLPQDDERNVNTE